MSMLYLWPEGAPLAQGEEIEDKPRLTPYLVQAGKPAAAVVVCPGGGYQRRAEHEGEPIARWLNGLGIHAFVLDYRVAPYRHPAPLFDAQRAIRIVRHRADEWGVDPRRVGILGFSAGGHLSASAATRFDEGRPDAADPIERQSCRPDAAVLCYPVITLAGDYRHNGSAVNLLGEGSGEAERLEHSAERNVNERTPPTFLWHTADDASVPVENALLFASALSRHRVPFDLHVYESGRHGLGLAAEHPEAHAWTQACALWLRRRGFAGA